MNARRPALPSENTTHPLEALIPVPTAEPTPQVPAAATVQLNVKVGYEISTAFDLALLKLSAQRGIRVTKRAALEEAITDYLERNNLS